MAAEGVIPEEIIGIDPKLVPADISIPTPGDGGTTTPTQPPVTPTQTTFFNIIRFNSKDAVFKDVNEVGIGNSTSSGINRALIKLDLTEFRTMQYNYAVLRLLWVQPSAVVRTNDTILEVYRPLTYNPTTASWINYDTNKRWSKEGGDWYDAEGTLNGNVPYGTITIPKDSKANNQYYDIEITALLDYYKTHDNTGFLIKEKTEATDTYVGFAGAGTNKPYVSAKMEEFRPMREPYIYIKGKGMDATADLTANETNADVQINQALTYAAKHPQYTHVYLKGPYTYKIRDRLLISSNITLEGDSTAIVQLDSDVKWVVGTPILSQATTSISNVTIRGFTIDGNRSGNENTTYVSSAGYYTLIGFNSATNIEISGMTLQNNLNDIIFVNNSTNLNIYNNIIREGGKESICIFNSNDADIYKNTITTRVGHGIDIYNTDSVSIRDNVINSTGSGKSGILLFKNGSPVMTNINIIGNKIHDCQTAGIWIYGYGSYLNSTTNVIIKNNVIYNNGLKQNTYAAGLVINGFNATIENNTFDSNYGGNIIIKRLYEVEPVITGDITMLIQNNNNTNVKSGYALHNTYMSGYTINSMYNLYYGNVTGNYGQNFAKSDDIIDQDPLYADAANGDYHEKSKCGRWANTGWVTDSVISPCIDAGNPASDYSQELVPYSGGRINIGAWGGTVYASLSGNTAGPSNKAPILAELSNQTVRVAHELSFTVAGTDEDTSDTLTYDFTSNPLVNNVNFNQVTGEFVWTPTAGQEGTYTFTFTVSDGRLIDSQTINIGVLSQNIATTITKVSCCRLKEATPTLVLNTSPFIDVGHLNGSGKYRGLLWYDLSEFTGKTITSATLSLYWYFPQGNERVNDTIIDVFRPLPWNPDWSSWNTKDSDLEWVNPGSDWYDANDALNGNAPLATITLTKTNVPDNAYHVFDVKDLIQAYADGVYANTGFLLKARIEDGNYVAFYSLNFGIESKMPKLEVVYVE